MTSGYEKSSSRFTFSFGRLRLDQYRGLLYSAQNIVKKDPGRAMQNNLVTAQTNFTKPGVQNKGDLCTFLIFCHFVILYYGTKSLESAAIAKGWRTLREGG